MPTTYQYTMWEAMMELVVNALKISTENLTQITDVDPTAFFIMTNDLNNILTASKASTDAIVQESQSQSNTNMQNFLYMLIAASCALCISVLFMIPVINKITKSK